MKNIKLTFIAPSFRRKAVVLCYAVVLSLLGVQVAHAGFSTFTYNHDAAVMNQILITEGAGGVPVPDAYYDLFHSDYRMTAMGNGKNVLRGAAMLMFVPQEEMAEEVDSALWRRNRVEMLNIADREVDYAWQTERQKLESLIDENTSLIHRIAGSGASLKVRQHYEYRLNAIKFTIAEAREAYMPNSQRKETFLGAYEELVSLKKAIRNVLLYYEGIKDIKSMNNKRGIRVDVRSIVQRCHTAWQESFNKYNGKENV